VVSFPFSKSSVEQFQAEFFAKSCNRFGDDVQETIEDHHSESLPNVGA
jgi:hypothetical protein